MTELTSHTTELAARIRERLDPIVADVGALLYDLSVRQVGRTLQIAVVIDNEGGWAPGRGVTIEQTSSVARQLNYSLETDPLFEGDWSLEVSSPGIERALSTPEHFDLHVGQVIRAVLQPTEGLPTVVEGELLGRDGSVLRVRTADRGEVAFGLERLRKAKTVFDFSVYNPAAQKPRAGKKGGASKPASAGKQRSSETAGNQGEPPLREGGAGNKGRKSGEGRQ